MNDDKQLIERLTRDGTATTAPEQFTERERETVRKVADRVEQLFAMQLHRFRDWDKEGRCNANYEYNLASVRVSLLGEKHDAILAAAVAAARGSTFFRKAVADGFVTESTLDKLANMVTQDSNKKAIAEGWRTAWSYKV